MTSKEKLFMDHIYGPTIELLEQIGKDSDNAELKELVNEGIESLDEFKTELEDGE